MKKNKKFIFIIWGLFISVSVVGLLILLLLFLQPKQSQQSFNQPVEAKPIQSFSQQEQEDKTYNNILKKIESEVESLTTEQNIIYQPDDKTISYIQILNSKTKKLIKARFYKQDGKTLNYITEYDSITGDEIKDTYYNPDGTVKEVINY